MTEPMLQGFEMSPQQRDLWRLAPDGDPGPLRCQASMALPGRPGPARVRQALERLVLRHEILRTRFRRLPGMDLPLQVIPDGPELDFRVVDRAGSEEALWEQGLAAPYDLAEDAPLRAVQVADERLLLTLPALCGDARGLLATAAELAAELDGGGGGEPLQYADVAEWLRGLAQGDAAGPGRDHWRGRGAEPPPRLPFLAPAGGEFAPRQVPLAVEDRTWEALAVQAAAAGAAAEDLVLAVWAVVLGRLLERADVPLGLAACGRSLPELEGLPGCFARTLPAAVRWEPSAPACEIAGRLRAAREDDLAWQDVFAWPSAGARRAFAVFAFEDRRPLAAAARAAGVDRLTACTDRWQLRLLIEGDEAAPRLALAYDAGCVSARDAARLGGQVAAGLRSAAGDRARRAAWLDLVSAEERRELLDRYAPPAVHRTPPADVVERFARWVEEAPERPAATAADGTSSYRGLERASRALAERLLAAGAGPESAVALVADRASLGTVVGVLGVLRAGAAYVPLDPDLPPDRLRRLAADSGAAALVAPPRWRGPDLGLRRLDADPAAVPDGSVGLPEPTAEGLAYVIYTSGSTGEPKGVAVERRQLAAYLDALLAQLPFAAGWQVALVSTPAADLGHTSLFGCLASGGCLHLVPRQVAADPPALAALFAERGVDVVKIAPSHLEALLRDAPRPAALPRRLLVLGGEATASGLAARVRELAPQCRVFNHYGPTETTVGVLVGEAPVVLDAPALPLDRPLAGSRVRVADESHLPVPRWHTGELVIGGAQLSRGYHRRPAATAERFRPDPEPDAPGARLYLTGDRARIGSRGELELIGRRDRQIKLRGYRVEPGEVESALGRHPAVAAVAVGPREREGELRLVAWYVPAGDDPGAAALRRHLAERLPEAMVPAAFVALAALPLTANGKLDWRALPEPEAPSPAAGGAPRDAVEEVLCGIWGEVLGRDGVGRDDDFFALGGHSLLVAQVVSRARAALGVELSLREVFAAPTAAAAAERVRRARDEGRPPLPPLERAGRDGGAPLSFSQQRLWFHDQLAPGSAFYNVALPVRLEGRLDVAALRRATGEVLRRHEVLRTRFAATPDGPAQWVEEPPATPLPLVDLTALDEPRRSGEASRLARREARLPFDLTAGALLRARLVRLGAARHLALLTLHHIAGDAWSTRLLVEELCAFYAARPGEPSPLPEPPLQYADYARWQRSWLRGERLAAEVAGWRTRLAGAPTVLEVPTDRPRPAVQAHRGGREAADWAAPLGAELRRVARALGATPFIVLVATFAELLRRRAGVEDVLIGTNVANRDRLETERLIGFFVNQLVLRVRLDGDPPFTELVARTRRTALEAYDHQHLPFEKLVEELRPKRDRSRSLLYQVKLDYAEPAATAVELPELRVIPFEQGLPRARYDLHLLVAPQDDALRATLLYDAALYRPSTVRGLLAELAALLRAALAEPDRPLSRLAAAPPQAAGEQDYHGALLGKLKTRSEGRPRADLAAG